MKKNTLTILFVFFTLVSFSQIEILDDEPVPETVTTVRDLGAFMGSLRKLEDDYFIAYRDWNYSSIINIEYLPVGSLEEVLSFKNLLLEVQKTKEIKRFKIKENILTVKPYLRKYVKIYILEDGVLNRYMGWWSMKKIEKLIPESLFRD